MNDKTTSVLMVLGEYDLEHREYGDCAEVAIETRPGIALMHICEEELGHDGPHDWDPDFEYPDDEDEDDD